MSKPTYAELAEKVQTLEKEVQALKAAEKKLNDQQNIYQRLFQEASMGILLLDKHVNFIDANHRALKILGYTYDEIIGMNASEIIHPDDLNAQPLIKPVDILGAERVVTLERHYLCRNGHYIPVEVNLRAFPNETMLVMFQDISQRRQAEDALRAANEALEVVYRCSNAAIVSLDRNERVTFWNPAAEKMFGWTQSEVLGKAYPAVPDEFKKKFTEEVVSEFTSGASHTDLELIRKRKDGSYFYVSATTGAMRNAEGKIIGLISVMIDITKRKQAEVALQQSEDRYRSLVENTHDGYFICKVPSVRFGFLNQRMCDLLGYSMDEGLTLTIWDVIDTKDHAALKSLLQRQRKRTKVDPTPSVFQAVRKDGETFRSEVSIAMVTFKEKPAIHGLLRDITEKERLQMQLQQAQRLESIGTLAGGIAHDFNNLLMAIQGNTSLALIHLDPSHTAYEKMKNITTYVQDASALTKQLLGFARGGKYEVKVTNLNKLIEKTAQMFSRTKKETALHTTCQPGIWNVEVDRGQIEQVVLNLLVNAWQAMPAGGRISVETENIHLDAMYTKAYSVKPGKYVKITVSDTGVGMDKATQSKIFEPFFTTKDRGRGTGLGLASSYGIIKNHDGIINVYSEVGKGTTFKIYLPAVEKPLRETEDYSETPQTGSETILLVDDEQMVVIVGQEMLEELGYYTLVARSGKEAIEIYQQEQHRIDLVILDMIMPEMSGGETFNQLKKINPNIKTLLSSGYSLTGEASDILKRGCKGFIQKPFNMEHLSGKIRDILDGA